MTNRTAKLTLLHREPFGWVASLRPRVHQFFQSCVLTDGSAAVGSMCRREGEAPPTTRRVIHGLGEFKETVSLEANEVELRGLDDRDGDGHCDDGEAWGRVPSAPIVQDRAQGITLTLLAQPCPPLEE